jgi:hypothetical protein
MLTTSAMKSYFNNPLSDNTLYKAILSIEFKRSEDESNADKAIKSIKKLATTAGKFTLKEFNSKIKSAQDYVYDKEMKEFAKTIRRTRR